MINVPEGISSQISTTKTYIVSLEEHGKHIDALLGGAVEHRITGKFNRAYGSLQFAQARLNIMQSAINDEFAVLKKTSMRDYVGDDPSLENV